MFIKKTELLNCDNIKPILLVNNLMQKNHAHLLQGIDFTLQVVLNPRDKIIGEALSPS
jgi:hypothetical protein